MSKVKKKIKKKVSVSSKTKRAPGKRVVRVCATGCRALGSLDVYRAFEKEIKLKKLDRQVKLIKTGCQGFCAGAPLVMLSPYSNR